MRFERALPADNAVARRAIYQGAVFQGASTNSSIALVSDVLALLATEFGDEGEGREIAGRISNDQLFERIGRIRKILFLDTHFHDCVRAVAAGCGFDPGQIAFDPPRLRVVLHRGHENPSAASVYIPHRDTWYAHPQGLITWWIPLHDLDEEETFVFYPRHFVEPVPNDSDAFDYENWIRNGWSLKIGWQNKEAGRVTRYPGIIGVVHTGPGVGFACRRGENLLFSGSHLHETRRQASGRARFSIDFRIVHLADHADGLGAPNVDNRSRGSALIDYIMPHATPASGLGNAP